MTRCIISPRVQPIDQAGSRSCWAAALAMLYNWKYPLVPKTPRQLAREGGQEFLEYYDNGLPCSADPNLDKFMELIRVYSLGALPLQSYTLDQWKTRLETNGPLAILAAMGQDQNVYLHMLVMEGIEWENDFSDAIFHIVDPNGGVAGQKSATELARLLE